MENRGLGEPLPLSALMKTKSVCSAKHRKGVRKYLKVVGYQVLLVVDVKGTTFCDVNAM
jgi:hypothetical protein